MSTRSITLAIGLIAGLYSCGHNSHTYPSTDSTRIPSTIPTTSPTSSTPTTAPTSPTSTTSSTSATSSISSTSSTSTTSTTSTTSITSTTSSTSTHTQQVAIYTTNLNDDAIPDTLRLYSSTGNTSEYDSIAVTLAGYETLAYHTKDPWTKIDDWFQDSALNQLPTRRLLLSRWKAQTVLLLFGSPDEVGNGSNFCIINIENNKIRLVLDQSQRQLGIEVPCRLTDLDGNGRPEFIYTQTGECIMDTLDGSVCSYIPYHIYTVGNNCELNKPLAHSQPTTYEV